MHTFAIIGFGLTGNSLFCQLIDKFILENASAQYKILIFEKNLNRKARGLPYQQSCPDVWTINNSAKTFKLTPNGDTQADWMEKNKSKWENQFRSIDVDFTPRALTGLYLEDQYNNY